jgi:hypothetical protein
MSLSSCASGPTFSGSTITSSQLRNYAIAVVTKLAENETNCAHINAISTSVLPAPLGFVTELWVATGCNKSFSALVTFKLGATSNDGVSIYGGTP